MMSVGATEEPQVLSEASSWQGVQDSFSHHFQSSTHTAHWLNWPRNQVLGESGNVVSCDVGSMKGKNRSWIQEQKGKWPT